MQVQGVLETAIYVANLETAIEFYVRLFGFEILARDERFCALNVASRSVLLLFLQGGTTEPLTLPDNAGVIPEHDGTGTTHFAFSIAASDLPGWKARLAAHNIAIESEVQWSRGGKSIFFRDPDKHLVELATPGVWAIY